MEEFFTQVWTIIVTLIDPRNLSHPELFQKALNQPGVYWAALVAVTVIVFTETGLLVGFLLPGDSLVRTFVPVVAGAANMNYRTFLFYNVFGGIGWITSMILIGYYLIPIANPPMQSLLGDPNFTWAKHIDKVVVAVVFLSIVPILWKAGKHWLEKRKLSKLKPPSPKPPV